MTGGEGDDLYIQDSALDSIIENGANVGLGDTLKTNQDTLRTRRSRRTSSTTSSPAPRR